MPMLREYKAEPPWNRRMRGRNLSDSSIAFSVCVCFFGGILSVIAAVLVLKMKSHLPLALACDEMARTWQQSPGVVFRLWCRIYTILFCGSVSLVCYCCHPSLSAGWNQALVEPPPMLSLSPGRIPSELDSNDNWSSLATPTSIESRSSTSVGRHDQRRRGQRSSSRGVSSGSASSGSRLTPPGQRTPSLSLTSPPSLKHLGGGVNPLSRRCDAAPDGLPANSEAFSPPPRQRPAACGSIPECHHLASPPCLLGFTACVDACTADRTTPISRPRGGAAPSASSSSGSSSSVLDVPDDASRGEAARPLPQAAADKWALPDLEQHSSRCAGGATGGGREFTKNVVQTYGGGHGESGASNDDTRREPPGNGSRGQDERTGHDAGESGRGGNKEEANLGGRHGNGRGGGGRDRDGGESDDDNEGTGNNGSGTQDVRIEEIEEDEDGEDEDEEHQADEEMDTFLRLSEVDFCEGIDVLQLGKTGAAARDSSIGGPSGGGGGDENVRVPRHLSDFFRSPLALDSTPKQSSSSIRSLSDVQTGARLFDSVKSPVSDDDGALSGSYNLYLPTFNGAVGGTFAEVANSNVQIDVVGSPLPSSSPSDDTRHAQTAEMDALPAKTMHLREPVAAEVTDEPCDPGQMEAFEEKTEQSDSGHRDKPTGDGGGGESEEEWLTGDVDEPTLEERGGNCPLPNLNATSTSTQEAEPNAERAAATVGTHWAGLNEDGSWRTEVARKAAGKAGEVEAERRRLAKIIADESWRSDAGDSDGTRCRSRCNVRRDSVIRLQSGNVRYAQLFFPAKENGCIFGVLGGPTDRRSPDLDDGSVVWCTW